MSNFHSSINIVNPTDTFTLVDNWTKPGPTTRGETNSSAVKASEDQNGADASQDPKSNPEGASAVGPKMKKPRAQKKKLEVEDDEPIRRRMRIWGRIRAM